MEGIGGSPGLGDPAGRMEERSLWTSEAIEGGRRRRRDDAEASGTRVGASSDRSVRPVIAQAASTRRLRPCGPSKSRCGSNETDTGAQSVRPVGRPPSLRSRCAGSPAYGVRYISGLPVCTGEGTTSSKRSFRTRAPQVSLRDVCPRHGAPLACGPVVPRSLLGRKDRRRHDCDRPALEADGERRGHSRPPLPVLLLRLCLCLEQQPRYSPNAAGAKLSRANDFSH